MEEEARALGYNELRLGTSSRLEEANKMYEKLGYKVILRTSMPELAEKYEISHYEDIKYSKKL